MTVTKTFEAASEYLAARGWRLSFREVGEEVWADLVSAKAGTVFASYGRGVTQQEAAVRAAQRYVVEQEPPETLPRRLP